MSTDLTTSTQQLQTDAITWTAKAAAIRIHDEATCRDASHLLQSLRGIRQEIAKFFEPHLEAAVETKRRAEAARKGLVDEQGRLGAPLVAAEAIVKRDLLAWETMMRQQAEAEEARLQVLALTEAETRVIAAAAQLEREGRASGDAGMILEAHDLLAQPIETPAVSVASAMPKVRGITYRDHWAAHHTVDVVKLAAAVAAGTVSVNLLQPNMVALNALARSSEGTASVPGVRFVNARQVITQGRM